MKLFITDLDHTLVGDKRALKILNEALEAHRNDRGVKVVYATGRSLELYRELEQQETLIIPDALITSVGTEIYFDPKIDTYDPDWAQELSLGWDRSAIADTAAKFEGLLKQPQSEQRPFKLSYIIPEEEAVEVLPQLEKELKSQGLKCKLIYSGSQDLDILPSNADKGTAAKYLQQKWGIESSKTVVCGDSGNDIGLFFEENRGIIVNNARSELLNWYKENQTEYRYYAKNPYAAGILEGLENFNFLDKSFATSS
ncbi:sucrose-phosphate phosphatase [Scytonema sp. UIC 10036]|uniref:sucrose-phosphate phosphatase n=1 Tax=Scytonema sp. UIC 10036 TaxID=2304196 RepID=UPI0012DAC8AE|nr:sucrose-phosphate phosphatase [Scytonema sp. UIC 10036]MUG99871.1 sucrose-phosphate phosphatase [Scytonema sp. UIC 10036]